MNIIKTSFGQKLKHFRKINNLTQEKFAEMIDINVRQLARIEAGESFVTSETLYNICKILNINPCSLFDFIVVENSQNNVVKERDLPDAHVNDIDLKLYELINKIKTASYDENLIDFLNIALSALTDKGSLEKLKLIIKGLELKL